MEIKLDLDNRCIRIDGTLFHLEEMLDGLCLNEQFKYRTIKHSGRTYYIEQHPDKSTKESIDVPMQDKNIGYCPVCGKKLVKCKMGLWGSENISHVANCVRESENQPQSEATIGKDYSVLELRKYSSSFVGGFAKTTLRYNGLYLNSDDETAKGHYTLEHSLSSDFKIYSVKRISDNSIWSVGEETNYGKILSFSILSDVHNNNLNVYYDNGLIKGNIFIDSLKKKPTTVDDKSEDDFLGRRFKTINIGEHKIHYDTGKVEAPKHEEEKKPILTTVDGVEKFIDDTAWAVELETRYKGKITFNKKGDYKTGLDIFFHLESEADKYIANNKKSISYRELYEYFFSHYNDKTDDILNHFKPKK